MSKLSVPLMLGLAFLVPVLAGCGGGNADATASNSSSASPASSTAAVDQASAVTVVENGVGTEPAQVVAIFLDSLRSGDENSANGVLTSLARSELEKTSYKMQPLGTPEGQFKIGRVGYPYEEKTVALVECTWTEPPAGQAAGVSMDIVCEVHREPEGWRIAGIGVTIPGTEDALVLDFENAAALQATIDAATGQSSAAKTSGEMAPDGVQAQVVSGANQLPSANVGSQPSGSMPQYSMPMNQLRPAESQAGPELPAVGNLPQYQPESPAAYPNLPPPGGN